MNRSMNGDISNHLIKLGDLEYTNIKKCSLTKDEMYKYRMNNVLPDFDEKLKSMMLLKTTDMDNNNISLTDRDIAFIGSYLNYHDAPFSEDVQKLMDIFKDICNKMEKPNYTNVDPNNSSNDERRVDAYIGLTLSYPHINSVIYHIISILNENNEQMIA